MGAAPHEPISPTAERAAFGRAIESLRHGADRLVYDPFARLFLKPQQKLLLAAMDFPGAAKTLLSWHERKLPGVFGNLVCRTRFIDETLIAALHEGAEQIVLLGSGFDSRPYRISALKNLAVFELDRLGILSKKRALLDSTLGEFPGNVSLAAVDFREKDWGRALAESGFDATRPTFFTWEGVTQYLSAGLIDDVFNFVASAALGSQIAFTYIHQSVIDGTTPRTGELAVKRWVEHLGEPWISGFVPEQLSEYLSERCLAIASHVGATEYDQLYLQPLSRSLSLYQGESVVVARVTV